MIMNLWQQLGGSGGRYQGLLSGGLQSLGLAK